MKYQILNLILFTLCYQLTQAQTISPVGGGKHISENKSACLSENQRAIIKTKLAAQKVELIQKGILSAKTSKNAAISLGDPLRTTANSTFNSHLGAFHFVDHDPTINGVQFGNSNLDYDCGNRSYDFGVGYNLFDSGYNHSGTDYMLWPFGWHQYNNNFVEVVASEAGTIIGKEDGFADDKCSCTDFDDNAVYIQHNDGSVAWYLHLKLNSTTSKAVGQTVAKGEYIGLVASSGCSFRPHLHLEIYDNNDNLIDPYAGNCNNLNTTSYWDNQPTYRASTLNTILTHNAVPVHGCNEQPNLSNTFSYGENIYFAAYYRDQLNGDLTSHRILRPNNSVWQTWNHTSPETYDESWWYWFNSIPQNEPAGNWVYEVDYNGATFRHNFTISANGQNVANNVSSGSIKIDPTFEHIGILYNISGDENLNSNLEIEYREQGNGAFKNGAVTMRSHPGLVVDGSTYNVNHHAGSAMFLQPNTTYDIRLTLTDPDGGGTTTTISASTKAYPTETNNYRYVAPGNGGGNGTSANPYRGLQTAADNAQPGITFVVRSGTYSSFNIATNGTANAPITFRSETTHAAVVDGANTSSSIIVLGDFSRDSLQHIIIDGLKIQNGQIGIDAQHTQFVTIKNCWIENVRWGYYNRREDGWEHDQYLTNNYILGRTNWPNGGTEHRAIDIRGNRNVVSFNTIKNFDDGVSTDGPPYLLSYALDIHNNDIQNVADDFVEVDGTISNTRVYRNRGYNGRSGVSLAPIFGGPCYVFRNELYNMDISTFKMNRGTAGMVIVHNSSSKAGNGMSSAGWQNTFIKNNVIIGSRYCFEEYGLVNGSIDDWDYNAYHSTRPGNNTQGEEWFKWNNIRYGNITELRNGTNIETNGIAFNLSNDIGNAIPPPNYQVEYSSGDADFQPSINSNFRNNGIQLANLNDEYVTDGQPDRGAYEFGKSLPVFGASFNIQPPVSQNEVSPGTIKIDPTFEHIGILYNIGGDANLNSNLKIEYKKQGNGAFKEGALTMRSHTGLIIDGSAPGYNHHAGSAMFLQANTAYDIRLTLTDPDGGGTTTTITASTKAYPTESNNYRYVAPGSSGGSGTSANPYRGLQTAANNAQAGITFVVRPGNYTGFSMNENGTANAPITFRSENPREAIINGGSSSARIIELGVFNDSLQHIIIDGFTIENGNIAIDAQNTQYLTVKNCRIKEVNYGIYNRRENGWEHDQYLTNNYLTGVRSWPGNATTELRGIDLRGNRNVVSFNTIEYFDDAISTDGGKLTPSYALDIHNNDVSSMVDDLIEVDFTVSNTRVYRNRGYNGRSGISLAPILGGPCYVFRNELFNMDISSFKMNRGTSGMVIVHNTASKAGNGMSSDGWQNTFIKNNVLIGSRYCFEEYGTVTGSTDDWDYNAYHSTRAGTVDQEWFKWEDDRYANLAALQYATDIESNGLEISLNTDIINAAPPSAYGTEYNPGDRKFQPYNAANFRNNGIELANINDPFIFDGQPDRGAYEYANTLPKFGVNFSTSSTNTDCTIDLAYAIDLSNNDITIQYASNQNSLTLTGLTNAFIIKVEDTNGNEIPSYINTNNELLLELCDLSSGYHYLVIQNKNMSNVYVKLLIL